MLSKDKPVENLKRLFNSLKESNQQFGEVLLEICTLLDDHERRLQKLEKALKVS